MHSTSRVTWLARTSATLAGRLIPGSGRHCSYESANRFGRFNAGPATIPHLGSAGAYRPAAGLRIDSSGWGEAPLAMCGREDSNLQLVSEPDPKFDAGLSSQSLAVH